MNNQNNEKRFRGFWLSDDIMSFRGLTHLEKLVWSLIHGYDKGVFYVSNQRMADYFDCTESSISRAISRLKRKEYVKQVGFDGRKRFLKSNLKDVLPKRQRLPGISVSAGYIYNTINNSSKEELRSDESDHVSKRVIKRREKPILQNSKDKIISDLITYWNGLGKPFVKHRENGKPYNKTIKLLEKKLKRQRPNKIYKSIDEAHRAFNDLRFKYRPDKISFPAFIKYTAEDLRYNKMADKLGVRSWLEFFIKGDVSSMYMSKSAHPLALKSMVEMWCDYTGNEELTGSDISKLSQFVSMAEKFRKLNNDMFDVIFYFGKMISWESWRWKPTDPSHLLGDIFWREKLPKAIMHDNPSIRRDEINLLKRRR